MKVIYKKPGREILGLFFLALFLITPIIVISHNNGHFLASDNLLNDRTADIIGSAPLLIPNLLTPSGLSGKGEIVGIADSGMDKGSLSDIHPDLQSESGFMPRVVMLKSYTDRNIPDDPNGHGTFMSATIVGSGKASQGQYRGIAPGASLYFQALLDSANNLKIPEMIEDIFRPAYSAGVRIHVDGWGSGSNAYDSRSTQIDDFTYKYPDFLPVFGAGNNGPGKDTLTAEANSKNALTVGSSQVPRPAFDPEARFADQPADSSSRGPTQDGRIKPELLAPGSALISACSSLVESNFAANSAYTRMGGTSMAAAVTGGALALLREELKTSHSTSDPSSALLKALLINGARSKTGDPGQEGFGILDLAGTVLALQEKAFEFSDKNIHLEEGQIIEYKLKVADISRQVKVTLAWVDPPGKAGADSTLVNDLDLIVQDPGGKSYYGNDFSGQGHFDEQNNVELVCISSPKAGYYTIKVKARRISQSGGQDFALVYGQPLKHQVVENIDRNYELELMDGMKINPESIVLHQIVDGKLVDSSTSLQVGSDIYLTPETAYIFGNTWRTGGIQALPTIEGDLLLEINSRVRDGGYYMDPQAAATYGRITVNGFTVNSIADIPLGAELNATINPALQTLWKLEAANHEISGFIEKINSETREIKLFQDSNTYRMASWAAISCRDNLLDCTVQDRPFGSAEQDELDKLMPGTKVKMQVSPQTQVVQSMSLERPVAIGKLESVNIAEGKILLDTGGEYQILPSTNLYRDKTLVKLDNIKIGDLITALLIPNSQNIIRVQAYSNVTYGRLVYFSPIKKTVYLIDSQNRSLTYSISKDSEIFRWGIPLETTSIQPGSWIRVIGDSTGKDAWRIDLAEIGEETMKTVAKVNLDSKTLSMTDNSLYTYNSSTRISKGGYKIDAEDIVPGDSIELTTLLSHAPWPSVLAGADVKFYSYIKAPEIEITARSLNGVLIIQGYTTANRLYLYRKDGSSERIKVGNGQISKLLILLKDENELSLLALDTRSGGMRAKDVGISIFPTEPVKNGFTDISGHWAEKYIKDLAQQNILKGYSDGSYHPDQFLSRAELVSMIARQKNFSKPAMKEQLYFNDYAEIPWWSLEGVIAACEQGLISGFPDGSFRPASLVTRSEIAEILLRMSNKEIYKKPPDLPYEDWSRVPSWAREAFSNLYERGLLNVFAGKSLEPDQPVTRAEAAALLAQSSNLADSAKP